MKLDLLIFVLLLPISSGCSWLNYSVENIACAPVEWFQECAFRHHMHQLANEAWQQAEHDDRVEHSPAYACGFKEGFVDYIESNGTGEPPAMPPKKLQQAGFRTPNAQMEIADWFVGFRHGARVARETGLRDRFVIPISLPPRPVVGEPDSTKGPSDAFPPVPIPVAPSPNASAPSSAAPPGVPTPSPSASTPSPVEPLPDAPVPIPPLPAPSNEPKDR